MPLIVEDGSGVIGANSLASIAQARDFASLRNVTLPGDAALTAFLVKGTDYVKTFSYLGTKTYAGVSYLPWPRTGLTIDDEAFDGDAIPPDIVSAVCQLCIEQKNGVVLFGTSTGPAIRRDKVGPLETEYAVSNGSGNAAKASMPAVDAYLKPYLAGGGFSLRTRRI